MTTAHRSGQPWDTREYQQIESASFRDGQVVVQFADGAEAHVSPRDLVPTSGPEPDWPNVQAAEFHLVVPTPAGDIEIPWDVIRVRSDPAYDAFWAELVAEHVDSEGRMRVKPAS